MEKEQTKNQQEKNQQENQKKSQKLQWHPAFCSALRLELLEAMPFSFSSLTALFLKLL